MSEAAIVEATKLTVRADAEPPGGWDTYVRAAPDGSIYHLAGWGSVMSEVLGHECRYVTVVDESGEWLGAMPLVHVRSRLLGNHLLSMPFLNGGGPIGTEAGRRALCQWAVEEARRLRVRSLELRCRVETPDAGLQRSDRKITVLLDLPGDADALMARFHPKLRANVRRAGREGVELRYGRSELPGFYQVFARNMRDLGTPVLPQSFFERMIEQFKDELILSTAYWQGRPIGGQISFLWGNELEMVWGSSLRECNNLKVTSLIHWEYMCRAVEAGCQVFNFGRCTPGSGTHEFKTRWGGRDEPLPWLEWSSQGGSALPSTDSLKFRIAVAAWKKLPLAVANGAGPWLARALP